MMPSKALKQRSSALGKKEQRLPAGNSASSGKSGPKAQPLNEALSDSSLAFGKLAWSGAKVVAACNSVTLGAASATVVLAIPAALGCSYSAADFGIKLTSFSIEFANVARSGFGLSEIGTVNDALSEQLGITKFFESLKKRATEYINELLESPSDSESPEDLEPSDGLKNRADKIQSPGNSNTDSSDTESSSDSQSSEKHIKEYGD